MVEGPGYVDRHVCRHLGLQPNRECVLRLFVMRCRSSWLFGRGLRSAVRIVATLAGAYEARHGWMDRQAAGGMSEWLAWQGTFDSVGSFGPTHRSFPRG